MTFFANKQFPRNSPIWMSLPLISADNAKTDNLRVVAASREHFLLMGRNTSGSAQYPGPQFTLVIFCRPLSSVSSTVVKSLWPEVYFFFFNSNTLAFLVSHSVSKAVISGTKQLFLFSLIDFRVLCEPLGEQLKCTSFTSSSWSNETRTNSSWWSDSGPWRIRKRKTWLNDPNTSL